MMPVNIGDQPQPDFDDPIGLMMDCHRRIERFLHVLQEIIAAKAGGPLDSEHASALRTALDYFQSSAPHHTADEERSLFPRMRQAAGPQVQQTLQDVEKLEADHREAERAHQRVDELGRQWLERNHLPAKELEELRSIVNQLQDTYRQHIAMEDQHVFPLARQVLTETEQALIGREMHARRGAATG